MLLYKILRLTMLVAFVLPIIFLVAANHSWEDFKDDVWGSE